MYKYFDNVTQSIVLVEGDPTPDQLLTERVLDALFSEGPSIPEDGEYPGTYRGWWGDSYLLPGEAPLSTSTEWASRGRVLTQTRLQVYRQQLESALQQLVPDYAAQVDLDLVQTGLNTVTATITLHRPRATGIDSASVWATDLYLTTLLPA